MNGDFRSVDRRSPPTGSAVGRHVTSTTTAAGAGGGSASSTAARRRSRLACQPPHLRNHVASSSSSSVDVELIHRKASPLVSGECSDDDDVIYVSANSSVFDEGSPQPTDLLDGLTSAGSSRHDNDDIVVDKGKR